MDEEARKQVREFLELMENDHGIKMDDIKDALKYYKRISRYSGIFANAIVAGLAAAFLYTIWSGVQYLVHEITKKIAGG